MTAPADATPETWVSRAPARLQPLLRLSRFDRPIGFWLLALPCLHGQFLGRIGEGVGLYDLFLIGLFAVGAVAMRGAGCTYNDIVDRDIDAQVARTAGRPLPAGQIGLKGAWAWLGVQLLVGLLVLLALPTPAQIVALCAVPLVAAYPFMKRITWWPQAWLGLTFNWGVLVGFAAVEGRIGPEALILYAGAIAWTIGYDTIYALQDARDDAIVGVRSTARLFGENVKAGVGAFYAAAVAAGALALWSVDARLASWLGLAGFAAHLAWQVFSIRRDDVGNALRLFRANRDAGLILFAGLALDGALAAYLHS
jgi:4-hydroxybenzoate polyprenyltransferase